MKVRELKYILRRWEQYYQDIGIPQQLQAEYLNYAETLLRNDVPVIFDVRHLSLLLGLDAFYLNSIIFGNTCHYRQYEIPKHSGGTRTITAPYPELKHVQQWIYENILSSVKVHRCAHGFKRNKSILTNAQIHVKNRCLLKIDLKDFFPSIKKDRVICVFRQLGYTDEVALALASICCLDDCLPQGAPTSPCLSNIISRQLDNRLYELAKSMNLRYTRYADDIAFSGNKIPAILIDYVESIIKECGFEINNNKVRLYGENGNKILTGISLRDNQLRLPREKRRQWGQEFHYILTYGFESHIRRTNPDKANYLQVLLGRAYFWLSVEPENELAQEAKQYLMQIRANG